VEEHYRTIEVVLNFVDKRRLRLLSRLYKGTRGDHKTIQFFSGQARPEVERKTAS